MASVTPVPLYKRLVRSLSIPHPLPSPLPYLFFVCGALPALPMVVMSSLLLTKGGDLYVEPNSE